MASLSNGSNLLNERTRNVAAEVCVRQMYVASPYDGDVTSRIQFGAGVPRRYDSGRDMEFINGVKIMTAHETLYQAGLDPSKHKIFLPRTQSQKIGSVAHAAVALGENGIYKAIAFTATPGMLGHGVADSVGVASTSGLAKNYTVILDLADGKKLMEAQQDTPQVSASYKASVPAYTPPQLGYKF